MSEWSGDLIAAPEISNKSQLDKRHTRARLFVMMFGRRKTFNWIRPRFDYIYDDDAGCSFETFAAGLFHRTNVMFPSFIIIVESCVVLSSVTLLSETNRNSSRHLKKNTFFLSLSISISNPFQTTKRTLIRIYLTSFSALFEIIHDAVARSLTQSSSIFCIRNGLDLEVPSLIQHNVFRIRRRRSQFRITEFLSFLCYLKDKKKRKNWMKRSGKERFSSL